MSSSTQDATSFEARYPNVAGWVLDGWIELGPTDWSGSFIRVMSALWMRAVLFGRASVAMPVSMTPSQKPIKPSRLGIKKSCEPFVRKLKQAPYNPAMQPTQSVPVVLAFSVGVSLLLGRLCRQLWAADRYRYAL